MSSGDFKDTNLWVERLPDRNIGVFAGGDGYIGDPTQGLLVIIIKSPDRVPIGPVETYRTPTKAGPGTITDAVGERLTLEAADGTRFYFDVATRQWVHPSAEAREQGRREPDGAARRFGVQREIRV
jgi:hypothetical protein